MSWRALWAVVVMAALARSAHGYEFAVRARTTGQLYQLQGFRLAGDSRAFRRHRFTEQVTLTIWDVGSFQERRRRARLPAGGVTVSWRSSLRLDHDFGTFSLGALDAAGARHSSIDYIPELDESVLGLDVLYGYLQVEGLAGGKLELRLGRQVGWDVMDAWALDGATVEMRAPGPFFVEVQGGLRVRDASPLASASFELDGTGEAECQEYVEAGSPGAGRWRLIDRSTPHRNRALAADLYACPQRHAWMPMFGAAVETRGVRSLRARLAYRRTWSRSVGVIGEIDRLDYPDAGYYPNELGQAPSWGTNEERLAATVDGDLRWGRVKLQPFGLFRLSLLHRAVDRAAAGVRIVVAGHSLEPELSYRLPTYDGDSIFSVFAADPSVDGRITWAQVERGRRSPHWHLTTWLRRYQGGAATIAYGVDGRVEKTWSARWAAAVSGLADGGLGGTRAGAAIAVHFRPGPEWKATGRLASYYFAPDDAHASWGEGSAQTQLTWRPDPGMALHTVLEATVNRLDPVAVRALGVLDLAFVPEM
jgi:hypothetical protein